MKAGAPFASGAVMASLPQPETIRVSALRIACDGAGGSTGIDPALGHPRVYLHIDDTGFVDCGYCDRRFILESGPADSPSAQ